MSGAIKSSWDDFKDKMCCDAGNDLPKPDVVVE